jgi:pilus assembly protein CpaC
MERDIKSKSRGITSYARTPFLMILVFCIIFSTMKCWAGSLSRVNVNITEPEILTLTMGKSLIIEVPGGVQRVSLADPEIADVMILTPWQIYLTGKAAGTTRFTLWSGREKVLTIYDLEVVPDITLLKEKIHEILPYKAEDVRITATLNSITLTGTVPSTAKLSEVIALAQAYAPKDGGGKSGINNLLEVRGVHQVMLEVQVSEISRSLTKKLGVNFNPVNPSGEYFISTLDNLSFVDISDVDNPFYGVSGSVNMIFRFLEGGNSWLVFINLLKDHGLLKTLAEPTLITLSGKTANFLAGGEFPIPVPQEAGAGSITIKYKPFGVGLNFTPIVLDNGKIHMEVSPEVSNLDFSNAVSFGGYVIPSLSVRRVSTTIELNDGQSFVIAGLLNDDIREYVRKFPMLGDIPILGSLFRSSSFQKNETELIIIVTPHLVKPVDMEKQPLPTDEYIAPDDFEFYLLGSLEGKRKASSFSSQDLLSPLNDESGLEGDFGHILP